MSENNSSSGDDQPIYGIMSTFMGFPSCQSIEESSADVVVSGVPFDLATSGRPGTRFGPQGIRQASANIAWEYPRWPWDFDLQNTLDVIDFGDVAFKYGEPQMLVDNLQAHAKRVLATDKTMLTLGGDHFIALPLLRAHAEKHGPVALIHFDAHTDTYAEEAPLTMERCFITPWLRA